MCGRFYTLNSCTWGERMVYPRRNSYSSLDQALCTLPTGVIILLCSNEICISIYTDQNYVTYLGWFYSLDFIALMLLHIAPFWYPKKKIDMPNSGLKVSSCSILKSILCNFAQVYRFRGIYGAYITHRSIDNFCIYHF